MLTLLIQDMLNGENQVGEIKVPLGCALPPGYGFWADAKEASDILQVGPSRIVGKSDTCCCQWGTELTLVVARPCASTDDTWEVQADLRADVCSW